jgi:hypothetical protein
MTLDDGVSFCIRCGANMAQYSTPYQVDYQPQQQVYTSSTGASGFVGASEGGSFSLKNGRVMNVISGEGFVKEDAIITDKRIYYSAKSGLINVNSLEEIVNIKDVTGTKIADYKPYSLLILAGIALIGGLIAKHALYGFLSALIFVIVFFIAKKSWLRIDYAGGSIRFSVKKYGLDNVRAFQRQIYTIKDQMENQENS